MVFKYFLDNSAAWAGLVFEYESIKKIYLISGVLGDSIDDLLAGLYNLIEGKSVTKVTDFLDDNYSIENNMFEWIIDEEGSKVKLVFSVNCNIDKINLKIIENDFETKKCIFDNEINKNELIDNILESCNEILLKYGIIGYFMNFGREFPIYKYLLLMDNKCKNIVFDDFDEMCPHGQVESMYRTNLEEEIKYLTNEFE